MAQDIPDTEDEATRMMQLVSLMLPYLSCRDLCRLARCSRLLSACVRALDDASWRVLFNRDFPQPPPDSFSVWGDWRESYLAMHEILAARLCSLRLPPAELYSVVPDRYACVVCPAAQLDRAASEAAACDVACAPDGALVDPGELAAQVAESGLCELRDEFEYPRLHVSPARPHVVVRQHNAAQVALDALAERLLPALVGGRAASGQRFWSIGTGWKGVVPSALHAMLLRHTLGERRLGSHRNRSPEHADGRPLPAYPPVSVYGEVSKPRSGDANDVLVQQVRALVDSFIEAARLLGGGVYYGENPSYTEPSDRSEVFAILGREWVVCLWLYFRDFVPSWQ
eukprot:m51a1_g5649 hypothetical protein (341) ;mRNA; r:862681-863752